MRAVLLSFVLFFSSAAAGNISSYKVCYATSLATKMPLIVYVGVPRLSISGTIEFCASETDFLRHPGIVVSVPRDGWLEWVETLEPTASAEDIKAVLERALRPPVEVRTVFRNEHTTSGNC